MSLDISATEPDWSREFKPFFTWCPSKSLLASIRSYQRHTDSSNLYSKFLKKFAVVRHGFWSIITGSDISINCSIGGGLLMPHPNGIVIHQQAEIGPNCLLMQQVTIGIRSDGVPVIAGHVDIGAGAKVLGNIKIGVHAQIGANAVVLTDVGAFCTAVGVPAKVISSR